MHRYTYRFSSWGNIIEYLTLNYYSCLLFRYRPTSMQHMALEFQCFLLAQLFLLQTLFDITSVLHSRYRREKHIKKTLGINGSKLTWIHITNKTVIKKYSQNAFRYRYRSAGLSGSGMISFRIRKRLQYFMRMISLFTSIVVVCPSCRSGAARQGCPIPLVIASI